MSNLFDQVKQVWTSSDAITTSTKPESGYMVTRFVSLDPSGIMPASDINRLQGLPEWAVLPALKYCTPTLRNAPRNKYPKKLTQDKKLSPKRERALSRVCAKFNVTKFHGLQIMGLLEMQGFKLESN